MDRPLAIVQSISTAWGRGFRSPKISARRNAVPEVLDLPEDAMRTAPQLVAWHSVWLGEPYLIGATEARLVSLPLLRIPNLDLVQVDDASLRVDLFGKTCFRLAPHDIAKVVYNFTDSYMICGWRHQFFCKISVHIAFGVVPDRLVFRRAPDHERRLMRNL